MRQDRRPQSSCCAPIDALEPRRLLAGFAANFNFQPKGDVPGGYIADTGRKYAKQSDLQFGWNTDNTSNAINRRTSAKTRYDTLALVGAKGGATRWDVAVPSGLYEVSLLAGDPKTTDARYSLQVEDVPVLYGRPTKASPWVKGTARVWIDDGRLTLTSGAGARNNRVNSIEIRPIDVEKAYPALEAPAEVEEDAIYAPAISGLVANEVPTSMAIPALLDLGKRDVRLWYALDSWTGKLNEHDLSIARAYKRAGFAVTLAVVSSEHVSAKTAKAYFQRLADHPYARDVVDRWQIGNEPNIDGYWDGTLRQYVNDYLKPAYEVLHAAKEPVVGAGVSWDVSVCATLAQIGYTDYCDFTAFHPYGYSGDVVVQRARDAKAAFGDKPMLVTEWNITGLAHAPDYWASELRKAAVGLSHIAEQNYYFALQTSRTDVGDGGAIDGRGKPNGPFYNEIRDWTR